MTDNDKLRRLKLLAKRHARSTAQPLHVAQDLVATKLGSPHWNALTARAKGDWAPSEAEIAKVEALVEKVPSFEGAQFDHVFGGPEAVSKGEVQGHPYALKTMCGGVFMDGDGWQINLHENPLEPPRVMIDLAHAQDSPMNNPKLFAEAIGLAKDLMQRIKARRFADWPRRATKPDADGKVRHPFLDMAGTETPESDRWYCLHCNSEISGVQIAKNQWHCPGCGASPINIFQHPFWLHPHGEKPMPVQIPTEVQALEPIVSVVDQRLRLDLNKDQVEHLIRCALFEDATNASERMGASLAEIHVDEDLDVFLSFEDHYWPEEKEPHSAREVAALLGVEVFEEVMWTDPLFAWPDLGTVTQSTAEHTRLILDAYRQHGVIGEDRDAHL
jgi:hypothetical protein